MLLISSTVSMCFVCLFYNCIKINRYEDTIKAYQKRLTKLEAEIQSLNEQVNMLSGESEAENK